MKKHHAALLIGVALAQAGCAIHPLPDDVTGDPTDAIIYKIRCEIKGALFSLLINVLKDEEYGAATNAVAKFLDENRDFDYLPYLTWDGLPRSISTDDGDTITIPDHVARKPLHPDAIALIKSYLGTAIAYRFKFQITENNDKTANANFQLPFTSGTFTLGLSAGSERKRAAERVVEQTDVFRTFQILSCKDKDVAKSVNWIYPISGKVGMDEVVDSYFRVREDAASTQSTFTSFTDKLTFTSKFLSSATPKVVLNPGGLNNFKLANADGNFAANRTDLHEVQFTITPPTKEAPPTGIKKISLGQGVTLLVRVPKKIVRLEQPAPKRVKKPRPVVKRQLFSPSVTREDRETMEGARRELDRQILIDRDLQLRDVIGE